MADHRHTANDFVTYLQVLSLFSDALVSPLTCDSIGSRDYESTRNVIRRI